MASLVPPSDQAADLLQSLSLESQTKTLEAPQLAKKPSGIQYAPVDSGAQANGLHKPFDQSLTPLHQDFMDPAMCYLPNGGYPSPAYYYGGYDGLGNQWDDYSRYANPDGVEKPPGVYGDNGSIMYHHGYGYAPYGTYHPPGSPVPTMGHDGQHYQYPTYFQSFTPTSGSFTSNHAPQVGVSTSAAEQAPLRVETAKENQSSVANVGIGNEANMSKALRPNYQTSFLGPNSSYGSGGVPLGISSSGYKDQSFSFDKIHSPNPWLDASIFPDGKSKQALFSHGNNFLSGRNQNTRFFSHLTGLQHPRPTPEMSQAAFMDGMYPNNRMYGPYSNTFRTGTGFGLGGYGARTNSRGWLGVDSKYKPRGFGNGSSGYGNENVDGMIELNRGPRAKGFNSQKDLEPIRLAVKGQNIPLHGNDYEDKLSSVPDMEHYNIEDLPETYADAKFFIIKSYSEDNVHKSIKYGVWASTPNGNKKLDAAYQESRTAAGGCPVFLFFSVNASGQFVGLAEMVGTVDFDKSMEYWQQDKWTGCFPVKWHIVKDVPNSLLKHITLENNENKPVTNSRDTQEVKFEQGIVMIKIFKGHSSKTCILDDFGFYEARQKILQEKKAKQQQFSKQVGSMTPVDVAADDKGKDGTIGKQSLQKSLDVAMVLIEGPVSATATASEVAKVNGELENNLDAAAAAAAAAEDGHKGSPPVAMTEKRAVSNGVSNAC